MKQLECNSFGLARKVHFHAGDYAIQIAGRKKQPDQTKAYVEFELSHAFPVVTSDGTAIHPATVANSFQSMEDQVFNLGHLMRSYDPENIPRDRILGCIVAVEFPPTPLGGWTVQADREKAPGIRAVASVFKKAEGVDRVLGGHASGRRRWTVSMENYFSYDDSSMLVKATDDESLESFQESTPKDLQELGWTNVPMSAAPDDLLECLNAEGNAIKKNAQYNGRDVVLLVGGLNGNIHYRGTGLAPFGYGKEAEARVTEMLAAHSGGAPWEEESADELMATLEEVTSGIKSFEEWLSRGK